MSAFLSPRQPSCPKLRAPARRLYRTRRQAHDARADRWLLRRWYDAPTEILRHMAHGEDLGWANAAGNHHLVPQRLGLRQNDPDGRRRCHGTRNFAVVPREYYFGIFDAKDHSNQCFCAIPFQLPKPLMRNCVVRCDGKRPHEPIDTRQVPARAPSSDASRLYAVPADALCEGLGCEMDKARHDSFQWLGLAAFRRIPASRAFAGGEPSGREKIRD